MRVKTGPTETRKVVEVHLVPGQPGIITSEGWRIQFHAAGQVPEISYDGTSYNLVEAAAPAPTATDKCIDGFPGLVLHHLNETDIGVMIENKGILLAPAFQNVNQQGKPVGPKFNYFAAPNDTRTLDGSNKLGSYNYDIQRITKLENVCGHDGIFLPNDTAIYKAAVNDPNALRSWHMPLRAFVDGRDVNGKMINPHNMLAYKDQKSLRGTFTNETTFSNGAHFYWTATEPLDFQDHVYSVSLVEEGNNPCRGKRFLAVSSRPVRAEMC